MTMTLPQEGKVYYPKGRTLGSFVFVLECVEDRVKVRRHDPGFDPVERTVRLSTFITRYDMTPFDVVVPS